MIRNLQGGRFINNKKSIIFLLLLPVLQWQPHFALQNP